MIHSPQFKISYITAGIICQLCSDEIEIWSNMSFDLNSILNEMVRSF
jgi:hypothetical protein